MQATIQRYLGQAFDWWRNLNKNQKIRLSIVVGLLALSLGVTVYMLTRPRMKPLVENQDAESIAEIKNYLDDNNIYNRVIDNETGIEVREQNYSDAKLQLTTAGIPKGGFEFPDAISMAGIGTSDDVQKRIFTYQHSVKLAQELVQLSGIESATVNLVDPNDETLFLPNRTTPTASVKLELSREFTKDQIRGVAQYVASSVKNMTVENVTVIDQNSNQLFPPLQNEAGSGSTQYELEQRLYRDIELRVKNALSPVYDDIRVMPALKFSRDTQVSQIKTLTSPHDPTSNRGVLTERDTEDSSATSTTAGEEPGVIPNGGTEPEYAIEDGAAGQNAETSRRHEAYAYNEDHTTIERIPGELLVDDSSIAVLVFKRHPYYEEEVEAAGLLEGTTWQAFQDTIKRQNSKLEIDQGEIDLIVSGTGISNIRLEGYEIPEFYPKEITPMPISNYAAIALLLLLIGLLAFGLIKRTTPEEITEIEPELSVEELMVSTRQEPDKQSVAEIDYVEDSELKKQIDKFVEENPEAVAQLLRNWLSDEWE